MVNKRAAWIGGLAALSALLFGGIALAGQKQAPAPQPAPTPPPPAPPPPPTYTYRHATDADVAADGTQSVYTNLLNTQPVGYTEEGDYNRHHWKFVVCSLDNCDPPSLFQKDVRGFVAT